MFSDTEDCRRRHFVVAFFARANSAPVDEGAVGAMRKMPNELCLLGGAILLLSATVAHADGNVTSRMEGATAFASLGSSDFKFEYQKGGVFLRSAGTSGKNWHTNAGRWFFKGNDKEWICSHYSNEAPERASCSQYIQRKGKYLKADSSNPRDPLPLSSIKFK
jgi:hypothetical protein